MNRLPLTLTVVATALTATTVARSFQGRGSTATQSTKPFTVVEATIPEMRLAMEQRRVTSRQIVTEYLTRIGMYEDTLHAANRRMVGELEDGGARLDGLYVCMHHPREGRPPYRADCDCRKPRPGMLLAAARDLGVRPRIAWMVGDKPSDVETGRAFGCRTAWVGAPSWRKRFAAEVRPWSPDVIADDLRKAASAIVKRAG